MTVIMLVLLTLAAFLGGAAFGMWWVSGERPVTPHRDIDDLARRDRLPRPTRPDPSVPERYRNADDRWYEQNDGWIQ